jgi:outer membrane protein
MNCEAKSSLNVQLSDCVGAGLGHDMRSLCEPQGNSGVRHAPLQSCRQLLSSGVLVVGFLTAGSAQAQAFDAVRLYGAAPGSDGGLFGAAVLNVPQYSGSTDRRWMLLPLLDYQWKSGWFAGTSNGVGFNGSSNPAQQYGVRLTADIGRSENRSPALRGLGDIEPSLEAGAFFNQYLSHQTFLTSSLRYGAGRQRDGLQLDLGAGHSDAFAGQWRYAFGAAATFVNAGYMRSYFGVDALQAARSGYSPYQPGAGVRDLRLNGSITYRHTPRLAATLGASVSSLQGDARRSPLVREPTSASCVMALSYYF